MSAQHTPGRLVVRENGDANSYALINERGHWMMSVLLNGQQLTETQRADLRRMAVCWNAFDGISPELAFCMADNGGVSLILSMADQHVKELTAARALLREALETFDDDPSEDHEIADRIRDYLGPDSIFCAGSGANNKPTYENETT